VSLPVYTRPFKPTEHIVTTKLSLHNLSPVYTGPYSKYTFAATTHKLNVSGHMLIRIYTFSLFLHVEIVLKISLHLSVTTCIYL
jgi:hypothetical protein